MATLPINLEVEDIAVGPVMIALSKMAGIIKMNLDIGGGAPRAAAPKQQRSNNAEQITALLMQRGGPVTIAEVIKLVGSKGTAYTSMSALKRDKVVKSAGVGLYELTDKARRELTGAPKLLAPPKANGKSNGHGKIARGPSGRAVPGAGRTLLLDALASGGVTGADLGKHLVANGIAAKGWRGVLDRAKRDEMIKNVGDHFELTAAGRKAQAAEATEAGA